MLKNFFNLKSVALIIFGLSSLNASSNIYSMQSGNVVSFGGLTNGVFFFTLSGPISNRGTCNTSGRFALNTTNPHHKTMMVQVLTAYAAEKNVQIVGLRTCTTWVDSDDVGSLAVQ
jgi:hypothetical protein